MSAVEVPLRDRIALNVDEAGALLGLSGSAVRRLIDDGVLGRVPHTNRVLVARVELDRFAAQAVAA